MKTDFFPPPFRTNFPRSSRKSAAALDISQRESYAAQQCRFTRTVITSKESRLPPGARFPEKVIETTDVINNNLGYIHVSYPDLI